MDKKVIAQGGFNTGRLYRQDGQKIYWWLMEVSEDEHQIFFKDVSRMTSGYIETLVPGLFERGGATMPPYLMRRYDRGQLECWHKDLRCEFDPEFRVPEGYDFGPKLNI